MRVDPGWTDWRHYQAGLADFGQDRFEEAIGSLEQMDFQSPDPRPKFYGLQVLFSVRTSWARRASGSLSGRGDEPIASSAVLERDRTGRKVPALQDASRLINGGVAVSGLTNRPISAERKSCLPRSLATVILASVSVQNLPP